MYSSMRKRISKATRILLGKQSENMSVKEIPQITDEEVEEAKLFFPMEKFFIFGYARSGTTMLTRLVRLHPEIHCNYQAHFFTRPPLLTALIQDKAIDEWFRRPSFRWNRGKDLSPVVLRAVSDFILERDARKEGKNIVGDKSPNNLLGGESVELLHKIYPDARLIYIIRDGRDAVLSHRFQSFIDKTEYLFKEDQQIRLDFAKNSDPFINGDRSIFTKKGIKQAATCWTQNVQETTRLGKQLFGERFLVLQYEIVLKNTWQEIKKTWEFLTVEPLMSENKTLADAVKVEMTRNPDADWQKEKAEDIAQSLKKGKQGTWQNYFTKTDKEIFHQIAGNTLQEWGYDIA
jgi:hypothetical protein